MRMLFDRNHDRQYNDSRGSLVTNVRCLRCGHSGHTDPRYPFKKVGTVQSTDFCPCGGHSPLVVAAAVNHNNSTHICRTKHRRRATVI
jgi:hypothetical protein